MKRIIALVPMVLLTGCGFEVVDTGYRGVETNMGKVVGGTLDEGMHYYNPLTSDITEIDVRVKSYQIKISCYTKDLQMAEIEVSAMMYPIKDKVHLLFQEVGKEWDGKIVAPIMNGVVKSEIGKLDSNELIANREQARSRIEAQLKLTMNKSNIEVSNIEIVNVDYADEYEKAVERKVVAIQSAIEAQNKTKQIEEEARQKIISAEAEAKSMKIRSEALSQNKSLVEYEAVQKWDGQLPQYMMGNSIPFINISKKD